MTASGGTRVEVARALLDVQAPVRAALDAVPAEMWRIIAADNELAASVTGHLMRMRGKMFRPTLVLLAASLEGPPCARAVRLAAVTELVHLATLVHDDSVDHSALRRGQPTVNSLFSHQVSVIMGDFLYVHAFAELVRDGDPAVLGAVTRASTEMTMGEIRQLAAVDALAFSEEDYEMLIRAKTASLIAAACEMGAVAGGGRHVAALARYGDRLGRAFQIADDVLDYTEDPDVTGKPRGLDLREHKVTLPLIAALRVMSPSERRRVEALFASVAPDDEAIAEVSAIVAESGGLEYARRRGERYAQEAEEALAGLPLGAARSALSDAIAYVLERRS
ncbi:MAG TPA: polyprenyl synthetase family protein [Gemmatimonadaceae bacterium]|nr:polyprenyl synthetase family protein [Gemmatimonadaceae bacterium]